METTAVGVQGALPSPLLARFPSPGHPGGEAISQREAQKNHPEESFLHDGGLTGSVRFLHTKIKFALPIVLKAMPPSTPAVNFLRVRNWLIFCMSNMSSFGLHDG